MSIQEVIIHLRFAPNGKVIQISERPAKLTPNQWFEVLTSALARHIDRSHVAAASSD